MTVRELLRQHDDAIVQRWLEGVLATYPGESCAAFTRQKDPFANPVGHSLRVGTRGIFEALVNGMDSEKIDRHLHEIIKIRAVQQFTAAQAVGFVFDLKAVIRTALGDLATDARLVSELAEFEQRIDRVALAAFDIFAQCRGQVCELRVSEAKRRVAWIMDKMNERGLDPELPRSNRE